MAAHFETFGPFPVGELTAPINLSKLKDLWKLVDAEKSGLSKAIGVYLLVVGDSKSRLPVYVGQSQSGFSKRLNANHHAFRLALEKYPGESVSMFLFARDSEKRGKLKTSRNKDYKPLKSINTLEVLLLRDCMQLNPELLNKSEKTFYAGLVVSGYLNDEHSKSLSGSAKQLKKLLRRRKSSGKN